MHTHVESDNPGRRWPRGKVVGAVAIGAVAALVASGVAYAAIPSSSGTIYGCYSTNNGAVRIIDPGKQKCASSEKPISWSQRGPRGYPGTNGTNGTNGVSGYELVHNDYAFTPGTTNTSGGLPVDCPAGKHVLGGGGDFLDSSGIGPATTSTSDITSSSPKDDGSGWIITYDTSVGFIKSVRVYATCATIG